MTGCAYRACQSLLRISIIALLSNACAETIKQDFNSMAELNAFWELSSWGNDNRTHSPRNVTIDNGVLVLKLSGSQPGQLPVCAEITSKRSDFKYGSYRASIKSSATAGGVVGWFIYRDSPLNEIDVEMLTRENRNVYFTLHHIVENVDDKTLKIDFDPSAAFHEYRFDWYADKVEYYIDSKLVGTLSKSVPDLAAQIMLNHWSGNIAGWGGAAPTKDMFMYVDYMYYTSDYSNPNPATSVQGRQAGADQASAMSGNVFESLGNVIETGDGLVLRLENGKPAPARIALYSLRGIRVLDIPVMPGDVARGLLRLDKRLDTHDLPPGTYVAAVSGPAGLRSRKVAVLAPGSGRN